MVLPEGSSEETEVSIYSKKSRAKLVEDGEMSYEEDAFMEGYDYEEGDDEEKEL